ncbi:hypothetical protein [Neolewinella sp.]|uniref:hypothetical protein n=1 Tax=Neolewinella sp. TaxID=2993543 RepID=UPI003B52ACB3
MAKLEDLFRRSLSEPLPPATPPPGQWERIRQGIIAPSAPLSSWWKFVAGVIVGMLLVGIAGWYVVVAPALRRPDAAPVAMPAVVERAVVDTVVRWRVDTVYLTLQAPPVPTSRERVFANLSSPSFLAEKFSQFEQPVGSEEVWQDIRAQANSASLIGTRMPDRVVWSQDYRLPEATLYRQVKLKPVTDKVPATLGWKGFTRVEKPDRPAGRWEIVLHVTPEISSNIAIIELYSEDENDIRPAVNVTLDERKATLYYQGTNNIRQPRQLRRLLTTHINAARQFSSGLRVAVGLYWYNHRFGGPSEQDLLPLLFEGEYYTYYSGREESLHTTFSGGYTFLRRHRFQFTVGALARVNFQRAFYRSTRIFSRDDRESYFFNYVENTQNGEIFSVDILPQLTLHYHLNDRLSVGTEIVPGLGLGARYKF